MSSLLQPRRIAFTKVHVDVLPNGGMSDTMGTTITTGLNVGIDNTNPRHVVLKMLVKFAPVDGGKQYYRGEVEALANFDIDPNMMPLEKAHRLAVINGASILYGAIREMVTNITARSPLKMPLVLGAMNFVESAEDLMGEIEKLRKSVQSEKHTHSATS